MAPTGNPIDLDVLTNLPWQAYPNLREIWAAGGDQPSVELAARMLFELLTIRLAERWLVDNEALLHGPIHSSIGQEAVAVGVITAMRAGDQITSTHRAHHHVLAKVIDHSLPIDVLASDNLPLPEEVNLGVYRTISEIIGLRGGFAGGRGGSMHLSSIEHGVLGTSAIVGGGIPMATGAAFTFAQRNTGNVAFTFLGDGASSIGAFHEAMSLARVWTLPVVFVIENNLYSVATTVAETVGFADIAIRAAGQNMPGLIADGMDPLAMHEATRLARAHASEGKGPVLIEAKTYRFLHQSGNLPGSDYRYRTKAEEVSWGARDPIEVFPAQMLAAGLLTPALVESIAMKASDLVERVIDMCTSSSSDGLVIRPELRPDPSDAARGVVGKPPRVTMPVAAMEDDLAAGAEISFATAISLSINRAMERDHEVFVMGEEVGHLRGGAYGTTKHASAAFPDRVFSSPIAENGFAGLALGAAMMGMRPIVELMFPDFALEGADQLFNHIPKARHMFGGDLDIPLVVRTRTAQGRGFGPQHSGDPAALFALFPGWRIAAPSTPAEYVGLFNTAITGRDPVLMIEHHQLWPTKGFLPESGLDFTIPFGKARVARQGSDLTVLTWSHPVHRVLAIATEFAERGIEIEVIDLRTIDAFSLDMDAIHMSVEKTGAIAIVEDSMASHSLGPVIAQRIYLNHFHALRLPIALISGADVPTPVARELEESVLLADHQIRSGIASLLGKS